MAAISPDRIHLSRATCTALEEEFVLDALRSGWVAPVGPHVEAFENEMANVVGVEGAVALSSGTASLHLALLAVGVAPGTIVVLPSMTFVATANAVVYTGAKPIFVDSMMSDANVDPTLMLEAVRLLQAEGERVAAAVSVDLYGRACDYGALECGLRELGVPLIEDAAEAVGSTATEGRSAGSFGEAAAVSFNGNKILTTSGGGMLLSNNVEILTRAKFLATQARGPAPWYEHDEVGFNYRLSNILAALGRAQLRRLDEMVERRRAIRKYYYTELAELEGLRFLGEEEYEGGKDNCWLTCIVIEPGKLSAESSTLIAGLDADGIEARHLWKPLHMQPVFDGCRSFLTGSAQALFERGLCLPSGAALKDTEVEYVVDRVRARVTA